MNEDDALQPLIEAVVDAEIKLDALKEWPAQIATALLELERAKSQLSQPRDGRDGKDGADGKDGVGIAAVARLPEDAMEFEFSSGERVTVELPRAKDGKDGKDGTDGKDGKDGNPGERGERGLAGVGVDVPRYVTGAVYRQGVLVQHFLGRTYEALCDTAEAPGDSPHWQRIGAGGQRWCGPKQQERHYEVGDMFVDGGTFLVLAEGEYQLIAPKPMAPSDVRGIVKQCVAELREEWNAQVLGLQRQLAEQMSVINRVSQAQTHLGEQLAKGLESVREWVRQWWQRDHGDDR